MAWILVVDDEPSARVTLALLLAKRGHSVHEAAGVTAAVASLMERPFDIVVTDLRMPDGAGLEVLRAVKAHRPEAEVIVLTAYADWETAKEAMQLGALDYFEKGSEPDGLFRQIDRALEDQAVHRASASPMNGLALLGSPRARQGERRVLTVLFADLRGSMELLVDRDLEEARRVLDGVLERMMEAVHRYGGIVNQVMGDGIMALFGAPVALDDHAARACRAATAMQDAVAHYAEELERRRGIRVQIRVGLSSGEAIVRSVGSDLRPDYTAVGPTTHVAARMEQLARPGTTLITHHTRRLAGGAILVRPLGWRDVKGMKDGVEVYEVIAA
jgi:class 3 adenylate cyclase